MWKMYTCLLCFHLCTHLKVNILLYLHKGCHSFPSDSIAPPIKLLSNSRTRGEVARILWITFQIKIVNIWDKTTRELANVITLLCLDFGVHALRGLFCPHTHVSVQILALFRCYLKGAQICAAGFCKTMTINLVDPKSMCAYHPYQHWEWTCLCNNQICRRAMRFINPMAILCAHRQLAPIADVSKKALHTQLGVSSAGSCASTCSRFVPEKGYYIPES